MALWFGKKDKNPPEVPAPVAKAQPAPPKLQTPPPAGNFPAVKPPQPTGLMPVSVMAAGAASRLAVLCRDSIEEHPTKWVKKVVVINDINMKRLNMITR